MSNESLILSYLSGDRESSVKSLKSKLDEELKKICDIIDKCLKEKNFDTLLLKIYGREDEFSVLCKVIDALYALDKEGFGDLHSHKQKCREVYIEKLVSNDFLHFLETTTYSDTNKEGIRKIALRELYHNGGTEEIKELCSKERELIDQINNKENADKVKELFMELFKIRQKLAKLHNKDNYASYKLSENYYWDTPDKVRGLIGKLNQNPTPIIFAKKEEVKFVEAINKAIGYFTKTFGLAFGNIGNLKDPKVLIYKVSRNNKVLGTVSFMLCENIPSSKTIHIRPYSTSPEQLPEVAICLKPKNGKFDYRIIFHEFGHALFFLSSRNKYSTLNSVPYEDLKEFHSGFFEQFVEDFLGRENTSSKDSEIKTTGLDLYSRDSIQIEIEDIINIDIVKEKLHIPSYAVNMHCYALGRYLGKLWHDEYKESEQGTLDKYFELCKKGKLATIDEYLLNETGMK